MATLLFSAIGTALGGPLGGALGALAGRQLDSAIIGSGNREGPRLRELAVTTSSYGAPLPRHFGRMRVAGTIIWSTDLIEHRDKTGGGKGRPSVTTYSYSASFAVALASRPILGIGRIWADGNLLRGAAGDLKTGGGLRIYTGQGDQPADPLMVAAEGAGRCPAFRGLAYAVLDNLDLADFGNRIPALTFEIVADDAPLSLNLLTEDVINHADTAMALPGLAGLSCDGPLADTLTVLDPVWPMDCDACADRLIIGGERLQTAPLTLPPAAASMNGNDFGASTGFRRSRTAAPPNPARILRYYDVDRDYQPGLQRTSGEARAHEPRTTELPAAMGAGDALRLITAAASRDSWARESLSWRSAALDPAIAPGSVVAVPELAGLWRVSEWEWRENGVELLLHRMAPGDTANAGAIADPGRSNPPADLIASPTAIAAFELPWDGTGSADQIALFAALSSTNAGWSGAALFADQGDGALLPLGPGGRLRSIMGQALTILPPASPLLFDRHSSVVVQLIAPDLPLAGADGRQLAMGANRALLGQEIIQFAKAVPLGDGRWRLEQLLRGRGGTETAIGTHAAGDRFVLLDGSAVILDPALVGTQPGTQIAAIGRGDSAPVTASLIGRGRSLRPLSPVHPRSRTLPNGDLSLGWTRRARGAWLWNDGVDAPLQEQAEAYEVSFGPPAAPIARWDVTAPQITLPAAERAALAASLPGGTFHVRQRGSYAMSDALPLATLA